MPICSNCNKVGHVACTCFSNFLRQNFSRPIFRPDASSKLQSFWKRSSASSPGAEIEVVQSAPLASPSSTPRPTDISLSQETLCLHGSINSHPLPFLINTGLSITAISHDTWLTISNPDIKLNTSVFLPIQSASGNFLCIYGSFDCHFEIDGSFYPFQTYVIHDLSHPVILGRDFLSAFALSLNFSNSSLHLRSSPLRTPLPSRPSLQQSKCFTVTVNESFLVLPPRAETVFSAKISPNVSPGRVGLVNPAAQLIDKYFLSRAYLLATVSHDHTVPVGILNPHPHAILLYPCTKLATLDCSDDVMAVDPRSTF